MTSLTRLFDKNVLSATMRLSPCQYRLMSSQVEESQNLGSDEEFRVLNLRPAEQKRQQRRVYAKEVAQPPRTNKMAVDQDWGAVWPGPRTFHPASVPLPLRQGFTEKGAPPPSKFGNAELMKIPNFLHLTPPVIKRQCEALKQFCTPWPKGLDTEEKINKHFPLEVTTSDYCHGLPTIRDPLSRVVTTKIKLSSLKFDQHARDKFLRLVGDRYDPNTDVLTIVTDRCPLKKQNADYAEYLLTACYHESFEVEDWESSKTEADMEVYLFNRNQSKVSAEAILSWKKPEGTVVEVSKDFAKTVEDLINEGENDYTLGKYKEEAKKLLGLARN